MKVQSNTLPNEVEALQGGYLVRFNIVPIKVIHMEVTQDAFEYDEVKIELSDTRSEIIDKIIFIKYSKSAEISLINNFNADNAYLPYQEYQKFRIFAKELADRVMLFKQN